MTARKPVKKLRQLPCLVAVIMSRADLDSAIRSIRKLAGTRNVRRIISYHNFKSTPRSSTLQTKARAAKSWGADIFKVATRTDTPAQLARLFDFITNRDVDLAISIMGIGKLGTLSRVFLAH